MKTNFTYLSDAIRVHWTKDGEGITGYKLFRYDTVTKKTVTAAVIWSADTTQYRDEGLTPGREYKYYVQPFNKSGSSVAYGSKSNTITAYTRPATVKVKSSYTKTTNAIRINWEKAKGADGYIIYRYDGKKYVRIGKVYSADTTTWRDGNGLVAGEQYRYKVLSYWMDGNKGIYGVSSSAKTASTCPNVVKITSTNRSGDAVRLNWSKVKCDGYQIYRLKNGSYQKIATIRNANTLTYRLGNLSPSTEYEFKIRAFRYDGTGASFGSFTYASVKTGYKVTSSSSRSYRLGAALLDKYGGWNASLKTAFNLSVLPYVEMNENPASGTEWFANYGLTYRSGNCYVMAGTFTRLARMLGYDARQVTGAVYSSWRADHRAPHSWVEIHLNGKVYICDPDFQKETGYNGYMFQVHYSSQMGGYIVGDGKHWCYYKNYEMSE